MRDEARRGKDRVSFNLDNRQIALVFVSAVAVLAIVFALGVVVGKGLVKIQAAAPPQIETASATGAGSGEVEELSEDEGTVIYREEALMEEAGPETAEEGGIKYTFYDTLEGGGQEPEAETGAPEEVIPPAPVIEPKAAPGLSAVEPPPKTSPPPKAPPRAQAPGKNFYFTVQVAAFQDLGSAEKMRDRLLAKGLAAYLTRATVKGKLWHRVRVGKFADRAGAENIAQAIQQKEKTSTFIDVIYE